MTLIDRIRRAYKLRRHRRYLRKLRAMGVMLSAPKDDERSSIEQHRRIVTP